ncbi:26S proteasome non-ATPase regulatory subunit 7-like [Pan troglodytes]|uniref:26S proteasome non-ATPase regulatory subunit 7-like n=1 Tax=Pan troglodytes TaxID=9598 RepID=UPI0023F306A1|nr:26S proteasome non-ATPase regulatory subunit 7-like [Pan troglodytes]
MRLDLVVQKVVVHPQVLLNVVDHFNRISKVGNQKCTLHVLLRSWQMKVLDVSSSFTVPFNEDDKDNCFLAHDYLKNTYRMFKRVNARERIVEWYHIGPKLHKNDTAFDEIMKRYCRNSVLVTSDMKPKDLGLPTEAYISVEVYEDGTSALKTFEHVTSETGAEEAKEIGVKHLLQDIKDTTVGTLSQCITNQVLDLKGLNSKLLGTRSYLEKVATGKLSTNHRFIYQLQVFKLLPVISL